ncbi:MAG: OmpA family protein [Bacteroidetes bacterium]|nr:OmpA family protein [Bacteroidota bacterium]
MQTNLKYCFIFILLTSIFFSCVPVRKFEDLKKKEEDCKKERDDLRFANKELETANIELTGQLEELKKEVSRLAEDTANAGKTLRRIQGQYDRINDLYELMLEKQKELVQGNEAETRKILAELQKTQEDLQRQEDELRELGRMLDKKKKDLDAMKDEIDKKNSIIDAKNKDLEARSAELMALQNKLNAMDSIVNALRDKVSKALVGFGGDELTIEQRNGKVYVKLEEKLLFKSGSFAVDQKGKDALKKLAVVLEKNPDVNILVEGHTDNVPYMGSGQLKDNWDLSVMRATSIVKILLEGSSIDPQRISASGRSEFLPVDTEDTKEAKAKNRRTEIILTPKLDELFQIIEKN